MDSRGYEILQTPVNLVKASKFQKIVSYFYPVKIWKGSSAQNPVLELFLHKGEWQLATEDAIYSDGSRYRPLQRGFKAVRSRLAEASEVLVLGAGLGSAVSILDKMGFHPSITLVDIDADILQLNKELSSPESQKLLLVHDDASCFVNRTTSQYDVIVIDIFKGRVVPEFVSGLAFLTQCRELLAPRGVVICNYLIGHKKEWETFFVHFKRTFPNTKILDLGINRVMIATV